MSGSEEVNYVLAHFSELLIASWTWLTPRKTGSVFSPTSPVTAGAPIHAAMLRMFDHEYTDDFYVPTNTTCNM